MSDALRRADSSDLRGRRAAMGLTLVATLALVVVDTYQTGPLRTVPEPRSRVFDADRVDASGRPIGSSGHQTPESASPPTA